MSKGLPASHFSREMSLDARNDSCIECLAPRLIEGPDGLWYELPHVAGCRGGSYGMLVHIPCMHCNEREAKRRRVKEHADSFLAGMRAVLP